MSGLLTPTGRLLTAGGKLLLSSTALTGSGGGASGISQVSLIAGPSQSNAGYAENLDGAFTAMATAVAFYLGAASSITYSAWVNAGSPGTSTSGIGVFELATPTNYGLSFLNNSAGASYTPASAAAAGLGTCGTGYAAYVAALTTLQRQVMSAILSDWCETDALEFGQSNKATYKAARINLSGQVRGMFGRSAASLPELAFAVPYGAFNGACTVREVLAEIAADPAQNYVLILPQTYDTISRNQAWNASTGVSSGNNADGGHRSAIDNVMLFKRGALAAARAIVAANGLSASVIPSALGGGLGPQVTAASISGTTLTLTVTHDGGSDLVVPLLAAQGVGMHVMDGGTIASPGSIIQATACARVDATHLAVTLASAPTSGAGARRFMYPAPGTVGTLTQEEIGRGNAVTDNWASVSKPSGFDISTLGTGWAVNMPLRSPISVTGSGGSAVAEWGLAF